MKDQISVRVFFLSIKIFNNKDKTILRKQKNTIEKKHRTSITILTFT